MARPDFNKIASDIQHYIDNTLPENAEELIMESIDANFDEEQYNESAWEPLSEKYAKRKGAGKRILSDTGDLRSGIQSSTSKATVTVSSDTDYAIYHNEGGSVEGRPPRRQFIPTEDNPDVELEQDLYDMIELDLLEIIR